MNPKIVMGIALRTVTIGIFSAMLMSGTVLAKEKAELPEVDSEGLHLVKDRKVAAAYAVPGADLSQYSKVMMLNCFVDFEKDWQKDYNLSQIGLDGRVNDKDAEKIKKRLSEEFNRIFAIVLPQKGFPVVDEAGPDVLLLRPALINVDVTAPDVLRASMSNTYIRSAGSMTLYMEMYDSSSSTLIARVVDTLIDDDMYGQAANRVTNKRAADNILRHWAGLLADHLGQVTQISAED